MAVPNLADELQSSFGPQENNIAPQTEPLPIDSGFEPEIGRLREIQGALPGAIKGAAKAEGDALRAKSAAEIAGVEALSEAAGARTKSVRGAYDAYGERIAAQPLPAFTPTEDNAETLGALFSGVNLLGLIMSRGAGRSSALGAMKSMTGMLEGYRAGRKDLYERDKQIFEKNYTRIKDIHTQYAKDLDKAVKLAEVDFEAGKIAAELAAKKSGNAYAEAAARAGDLKAVVTSFNEEAKIIKQITDLTNREMERESRAEIAALRASGKTKSDLLEPRATIQDRFDLSIDGLNSMANILEFKNNSKIEEEWKKNKILNFVLEPVSDGYLSRATAQIAKSKLSPEARNLAEEIMRARNAYFLATSGKAVTGNEAMRNFGAVLQPSDTFQDIMRKAERQALDTARKTADYSAGYNFPEPLKQSAQTAINRVARLSGLSAGPSSGTPSPSTPPAPAPRPVPTSTGSGTQDIEKLAVAAFGSYDPDTYEYGTNPDTGKFGRRKK